MNTITPEMYRAVEQQRDEAESRLRLLNVDVAFYRLWLAERRQEEYESGTSYGFDAYAKAQNEFDMHFPK